MRVIASIMAVALLSLVVASSRGVADQRPVYKVGLPETGYVPFGFPKSDPRPGIFMEILAAIGKATNDRFEPVYAPTARLKQLFANGQIDIECGISPEWRSDQADISVYSRPFTQITDVAMKRAGEQPFEAAQKGTLVKVGAVRGYTYPRFEDNFSSRKMQRFDSDNEQQLMVLLHKKRVDLILIGKMPALYLMKVNQEYRFAVEKQIDSVPVMYRIHKSKKELLARFNKALNSLLKGGEVDRIIADHR